jgi:hypothetical protein
MIFTEEDLPLMGLIYKKGDGLSRRIGPLSYEQPLDRVRSWC